jgi:pyruvate/2-oxoglutarate dehydrogenase complex dihydrolipoamide acyltransferase (E2) component
MPSRADVVLVAQAPVCVLMPLLWQVGTRVVMAMGKRWQGVGTISRIHDNGTTCAVKWDSGRLDRSLLVNDIIVKVVGGAATPAKSISDSPASPASTPGSAASQTPGSAASQTPSSQDKSYTPAATPTPPAKAETPPAKAETPSPSPSPQPLASPSPAKAPSRLQISQEISLDAVPSLSPGTGKGNATGGGKVVAVVGLAVVVGAAVAFSVMKRK